MIGYAMLYAAAVGVPLLLAATAVAAMLRKHGRRERAVWLLALAMAVVVPVAALVGAPEAEPGVATGWTMETDVGAALSPVAPQPIATAATPSIDYDRLLLASWLLASLALALHWVVATYRLARASRSWQSGTVDGVPAWLTADLGPAVSGTFRPRVLAPRWMLDMSAERRSLILRHEMEHIRAKDPLLVAFLRFTRILTPWSPAVWILGSRLVRAIELDCDRRVLSHTKDVGAYGQTLLALSARRPAPFAAAAAFAESEASFRGRILALTTPSRPISIAALASATVLGVVLIVGMLQIPVPGFRFSLNIGGSDEVEVLQQHGPDVVAPVAIAGDVSSWTPPVTYLTSSQVTALNGEEMNAAFADFVSHMQPVASDHHTVGPAWWEMQVWLNVGASGGVIEVRTSNAWGITPQDQAALAQLYLRARFAPLMSGGQSVPFWLRMPVGGYPVPLYNRPVQTPAAPAEQVVPDRDRPRFTPVSVWPALLNSAELASAFSAAVPAQMRAAGTQATTLAWLHIATDGTVQRTAIVESSGDAAFDDAALQVARGMRFSPARNRDQAVAVWVQVPLTFRPVTGTN